MSGEDPRPLHADGGVEAKLFSLLANGDWHTAVRTAEEHFPTLLSRSPGALAAAYDAVPPEQLATSPRWAVMRTYLTHLLSSPGRSAMYPDPLVMPSPSMRPADRIMVQTATIASLRTRGRFAPAAEMVDTAGNALRRFSAEERRLLDPYLSLLLTQWGGTLALAGRLIDAAPLLEHAAVEAQRTGNVRTATEATADLAWVQALLGEGAAAEDALRRHDALRLAAPHLVRIRDGARLARAQRSLDGLDFERGLELLQDDEGFDELLPLASALRAVARARSRRGDPMTIRTQLEVSIGSLPGWTGGGGMGAAAVAIARSTLPALAGMHEAALQMLRVELLPSSQARALVTMRVSSTLMALGDADHALVAAKRAARTPFPRSRIESLAVRAAAMRRTRNEVSARAAFREAVALAEEHSLPAALVSLTAADLSVLGASVGAAGLVRTIDERSLLFPEAPYGYHRLTPQQFSTLRALADSDTVERTAERLGVSPATTKSHVREIYRRFGVNNRAAALAEGRRRGLI